MTVFRALIKSIVQAILQPLATGFVVIGIITSALWPIILAFVAQSAFWELSPLAVAGVVVAQVFWWIVIAIMMALVIIESFDQP